jgi:hypothetical protein
MGTPDSATPALCRKATEQIAWVRKVNERWLVRSDLQQHATDYLDYLAKEDPTRLAKTCLIVQRMMEMASANEDPKPRFYGALFSLTSATERERFLASHHFTRLTLPGCHQPLPLSEMSPLTQEKVIALRNDLEACMTD